MRKQGTGRQQPRIMQYGRLQIAAIEMLYLIFFLLFALRDRYKCKAKTGSAQKTAGSRALALLWSLVLSLEHIMRAATAFPW